MTFFTLQYVFHLFRRKPISLIIHKEQENPEATKDKYPLDQDGIRGDEWKADETYGTPQGPMQQMPASQKREHRSKCQN